MVAKSTKQDQPVSSQDKEELLADLRKSMKDLGRIPRMLMAPIIAFVASKWDSLPTERKEQLQKISNDIKASGKSGIKSLKERFNKVISWTKQAKEATEATAKQASEKVEQATKTAKEAGEKAKTAANKVKTTANKAKKAAETAKEKVTNTRTTPKTTTRKTTTRKTTPATRKTTPTKRTSSK